MAGIASGLRIEAEPLRSGSGIQLLLRRNFKQPCPFVEFLSSDIKDSVLSGDLIADGQPLPDHILGNIHVVDFGCSAKGVRLPPEFIPFRLCPEAKIKNDIDACLQRLDGDMSHEFLHPGVTRVMLRILDIVAEEKVLPFIRR